ncbi:MAG: SPOR domain-containing protein [Deinococcaceae bacterium]
MSWMRRNWPDVLIVVFILVLVAGFGIVLTQGTLVFEVGRVKRQPETVAETPKPTVRPQVEPSIPKVPTSPEQSETKPTETESVPEIPSVPLDKPTPKTSPVPTEKAESTSESVSKPNRETSEITRAPKQPEEAAPVTAPSTRVTVARVGIPSKSDYRISAGLYSSESAAQDVADKIETLGYPTYVLPSQNDTWVVLTGPFANRRDADLASGEIGRIHENLFVYAPSRSKDAVTPAEPGTPTQVTETQVPTPSTGSVSLQVGAYRNEASAEVFADQLRQEGYAVSLQTTSNGLIRVLVGPVLESNTAEMQSKLQMQGHDSFVVR